MTPSSLDDLRAALSEANARGQRVERVELRAWNRVLAHAPEDMTVTVEAGLTLAGLQAHLARRGQWLPIDPPHPERRSIGAIIATNASGPRRYGYGTIREHLIGLAAVLADGRLIHSGGKVVKNVAGYDLQKLFVGSRGTLGVIVEATFKLLPLPEAERFVQVGLGSLDEVDQMVGRMFGADLNPVALDLHKLPEENVAQPLRLVLGFAGSRAEVEEQLAKARELGMSEEAKPNREEAFWSDWESLRSLSALPSKMTETLRGLGAVAFVARLGNGVIYYRGGAEPPRVSHPTDLLRRVKEAFDPRRVFPSMAEALKR